MKIDLNNYEAWFILYMDNELSAGEKLMVDSFLEQNPDLQYEWQLLQDSRLPLPDSLSFEPKASLYRSTEHNSMINEDNFQEYLLSSIDNELSPAEQEALEAYIAAHPAAAKEFMLFKKTVAEPELIAFPNKETLYRAEKPARIIAISWRRIAVAASILFALGTTAYFILGDTSSDKPVAVTKGPAEQPASPNSTNANASDTPIAQPDELAHQTESTTNTDLEEQAAKRILEPAQYAAVGKKETNEAKVTDGYSQLNQVQPDNKEVATEPAYADNRYVSPVQTKPIATENTGNAQFEKNINSEPVTPATASTLDLPKEQATTVAMLDEEPRNKSYRGLLRKATRVMERKANINATTEDDRLLIAGFAVKLN